MAEIKRQSPVQFSESAVNTEQRQNWTVTLEYSDEGQGPWVVDLCHKSRWDLQDGNIVEHAPSDDLAVPEMPGECTLKNDTLINRMNRTQAAIWHLGGEAPEMPDFIGYTDVTEATVFLTIFGSNAAHIAEKLTALDVMGPDKETPYLLQGPFCHVPCQIVTLQKGADGSGGLLLTCSRGYAESMVHAILDSGAEYGLRPAGETRFADWLQSL
jgi:hypothetical protein